MGKRVVNLALDASSRSHRVVVNAPIPNEIIRAVRDTIDIPIVVTVVSEHRFQSPMGRATILNVSGAKNREC